MTFRDDTLARLNALAASPGVAPYDRTTARMAIMLLENTEMPRPSIDAEARASMVVRASPKPDGET